MQTNFLTFLNPLGFILEGTGSISPNFRPTGFRVIAFAVLLSLEREPIFEM